MNKGIPLSVPNFKGKELEYVTNAIKSTWVSTEGEYVKKFEDELAKYLKVDNAVACNSGTAAIHLALKLCEINEQHEVIVPTLTFIAAVNPVRYVGANPIFMDCDNSLNMDLNKLEEFCKERCYITQEGLINKRTNRQVKSIIIVHIFGNMANMERLMSIAKRYKLLVIEDATESLGSYCIEGKYKNMYSGTIGNFGAYSFNGNKIITTGGGGILVAKNSRIAKKAKYLSTQAKDDPLYYIHNEVGYNYRMTNLQAALGLAQLEQLETFIKIKTNNYNFYKNEIGNLNGLKLIDFNKNVRSNYWFYSLLIDKEKYGLDRDELLNLLNKNNIGSRPIWELIHRQEPYKKSESYKIDKAYYYLENIINLPCSTDLTRKDISKVVNLLKTRGG